MRLRAAAVAGHRRRARACWRRAALAEYLCISMASAPRVLFMHGLESGPGGRKARHCAYHFDAFVCPPMESSPFDPRQRHSVSRWAGPYLMLSSIAVAAAWQKHAVYGRLGRTHAVVATTALVLGGLVPLLRWRLRASVDSCVQLQREAIASFRPDVVVASSWGSLVALRCIELGYWDGPAVLLAPAVAVHGPAALFFSPWHIDLPAAYRQRGDSVCTVVQGETDELVSPRCVADMSDRNGLHLEVVKDGDHSLNAWLGLRSREERIGRLHEMVRQQAAAGTGQST
jgi:hypothetical protein